MSTTGKIELHGGKLVVNIPTSEGPYVVQITSTKFIPGDKVTMSESGTVELVERKEQAAIGIVKAITDGTAKLYIANLGPSCPFEPDFPITTQPMKLHDRVVLWLESDGSIQFRALYSPNPIDDAPCLLKMYSLYKKREDFTYLLNDYQKPLYTIDHVVNHNALNTFTIDPASSEDFDDAISVDVANNTIYVHIVDIASADCQSLISEQARRRLKERCLTLYLANEHTEHLLDPEVASNKLSLIVGQERNVITVKAVMNETGTVQNYDIYRSTIVVKNRWNYDMVSDMLKSNTAQDELKYLVNLSNNRSSNVSYNINLPSMRFQIDKGSGLINSIRSESTNDDSHKLVATAMVLANLIVSKHLNFSQVRLPNRFHESLHGMTKPNFHSTGNQHVDSFIMVKRYARACYCVDKKGHFGLGLTDYVHFTSPMRRYADVLVHMLLSGAVFNEQALDDEVEWMNFRSSVVRSIQDLYNNWKITRQIQYQLECGSNQFDIWITDVKKGGVLWFMPEFSLNGFTHVSMLSPKQFWYFDYSKNTLSGQVNAATVAVGKRFIASIESIDPVTFVPTLTIHTT
jgi:exoribonuclease R